MGKGYNKQTFGAEQCCWVKYSNREVEGKLKKKKREKCEKKTIF